MNIFLYSQGLSLLPFVVVFAVVQRYPWTNNSLFAHIYVKKKNVSYVLKTINHTTSYVP